MLLLGTLPGERSLALAEYYAHPSNAFWRLLGGVLSEPRLPNMLYADKVKFLHASGIGVWDVLSKARRTGSLDTAIRDATHRDLVFFASQWCQLKAICFNGSQAARWGRGQFLGHAERWALIDLPSSSGAHARMPYLAKLRRWKVIESYL